MTLALRPRQIAAINALRAGFARGLRRQLLVAPTGFGKTETAQAMAAAAVAKGRRVLFLAHRRELIHQPYRRFTASGLRCGVVMGDDGRVDLGAPIQIASVPTLAARTAGLGIEWGLIIVDECHHVAADTHTAVVMATGGAPMVGLTATPWRTDGRGLRPCFDDLVVAATPAELLREEWLCPYAGFTFEDELAYGEGATAGAARVVGGIVDRYVERTSGRKALVFASTVPESKAIAAAFIARGIRAEHVDAKTPTATRDAITARFASGETLVMCNVGIFGEGYDVPDAEVCILARHTESLALYLQMIGRVLRCAPGKQRAYIHDHGRNIATHGLPDDERDYSLSADKSRKKKTVRLMTCRKCYAIFEPAKVCPVCGHTEKVMEEEAEQIELELEEERARLVEIEELKYRKTEEGKLRTEWERLLSRRAEKGYKLAWAWKRFEENTGKQLPIGWWRSAKAEDNRAARERQPGMEG